MRFSLPHAWKPRHYQQRTWDYLSAGGKRAVLNFHRRAGKDELCLHHTACAAMERQANYWLCMPQYGQARKAMWDGLNPHTGKRRIDEAFPVEIRAGVHEQEMKIKFKNGSTWQLVGSDNPDSLVGSPPLGIVFSEYALSNPSAWGYLRPILLENGGWGVFNSTPRGKNGFHKLCNLAKQEKDWFYEEITVEKSGIFTPEELASELREMQNEHGDEYGKSLWLQEYWCSFDAAIIGSIWGDCVTKARAEGRVGKVPFDENVPVHTAWDLGHTDSTAVWFWQPVYGEVHIIDFMEYDGRGIEFYADQLRSRTKEKGYVYGTHYLPHDARARTLAAGGKSIQQQLQAHNVGRIVIAPRLDVEEGIQAARATFPKVWIDESCEDGIEHLSNYRREYDEEKKVFSNKPVHDASSHAADAFRVLSLVWKHPKSRPIETPIEERMLKASVQSTTWGDVKKKHFDRKRRERSETIH